MLLLKKENQPQYVIAEAVNSFSFVLSNENKALRTIFSKSFVYPNAASQIIIKTTPIIPFQVPVCGCLDICASGIKASAAANIIAPAANDNSHGCAAEGYAAKK
ncbi:MAG: hypothetical protein KH354_05210 [Clostridiales bacterium]|nr:hypothetical protein [Clostridiales bacterium]